MFTFLTCAKRMIRQGRCLYPWPLHMDNMVVFAAQQQQRLAVQRLSTPLRKQMEQAIASQERTWFDRLIDQCGLLHAAEDGWTQLELMHCLNSIA